MFNDCCTVAGRMFSCAIVGPGMEVDRWVLGGSEDRGQEFGDAGGRDGVRARQGAQPHEIGIVQQHLAIRLAPIPPGPSHLQ